MPTNAVTPQFVTIVAVGDGTPAAAVVVGDTAIVIHPAIQEG